MKFKLIRRYIELLQLRGLMAMNSFKHLRTEYCRISTILFFRYGVIIRTEKIKNNYSAEQIIISETK